MSTHVRALSPAARLCAFCVLVLLLFLGAMQIGHRLGPVGPARARSTFVAPSGGGMNMGAGVGPAARSATAQR
jgi:predicted permease